MRGLNFSCRTLQLTLLRAIETISVTESTNELYESFFLKIEQSFLK